MKIIKTKSGVEIKVYSSPKEMPIGRYSDFQKYLTPNDLSSILYRAKAFMQEGKFEDSEIEINNAIEAYLSLHKGVGVLTYAFAVMVAQIGSKVASDTTIEGLDAVISELTSFDITQYEIEVAVEELKKK